MSTLIENNGSVALYRGENDEIIVSFAGNNMTLQSQLTFNYSYTWNPVFVDFYDDPDPSSTNDGNLLLLWRSVDDYTYEVSWQALSFSREDGGLLGLYSTSGIFRSVAELTEKANLYYGTPSYDIYNATNYFSSLDSEIDLLELYQLFLSHLFPLLYPY